MNIEQSIESFDEGRAMKNWWKRGKITKEDLLDED